MAQFPELPIAQVNPFNTCADHFPAGQTVQSARRVEPVPLVNLPGGQSRQKAEAGSGWYLETGQEVHTPAKKVPLVQSELGSLLLV